MAISLADYERRVPAAVAHFWATRGLASAAQQARGVVDVGGRSAVTGGKAMDGFIDLVRAVVVENGLSAAEVYASLQDKGPNRDTVLPGFYRPVKDWDLVVVHQGRLVAALEFKSQVGSFGNNANNRAEEAIGMGEDLRVAFRTGLLGPPPKPFVGYLMLLEDAEGSRRAVGDRSRHFGIDPVFEQASYARRYEVLCRRLVAEELYTSAALLLTPAAIGPEGAYSEVGPETGVQQFLATLAGHVASATTWQPTSL